MKSTTLTKTFVIVFGIGLVLVVMVGRRSSAHAQANGQNPCSVSSLTGSFGFTATGTVDGVGPVAQVGLQTFDGQGNFTGTGTVNGNGVLIGNNTLTGTYTVNPDCTGSFTLTSTLPPGTGHANFVIDSSGQEFRAIQTDPGEVITVEARKQFAGGANTQ